MKTEMIRRNQKMVDAAWDALCDASGAVVMAITSQDLEGISKKYLDKDEALDIDRAIAATHKGLSMLYQLQFIRDKDVTVNLSESTNGMVESDTPLLDAGESPVIRSLPVTDKIVPLNWVSGALPEMQRTH